MESYFKLYNWDFVLILQTKGNFKVTEEDKDKIKSVLGHLGGSAG